MLHLKRLVVLAFAVLTLSIGVVSAHGDTTVGEYVVNFGWWQEPAYAGQLNGPEVTLGLASDHHTPFPEDIAVDLHIEVSFGPESRTLFLKQQGAGYFTADFIPTRPGDYVFHLTGTIGETEVDLTFDSADGEFSSVNPAEDLMFPAPAAADATIAALEARIAALEARLAALEAGE